MYGKRDVIAYPIKDAVYARQYILNELNARKSFDPYTTYGRVHVSFQAYQGARSTEYGPKNRINFRNISPEISTRTPVNRRYAFPGTTVQSSRSCVYVYYIGTGARKSGGKGIGRERTLYIYRKTVAVDRNETVYDDYRKKRLPNFSFYFLSPPRAPRYLRVNTHTHTQAVRYSFL